MTESAKAALLEGRLWREFCLQLAEAGEQVLADGVPDGELTRVEGYRYLTRLLRLALEKNIEFADPQYPQFYSLSHETAKIGNDNPDNYYMNCEVDGGLEYRITGNSGDVDYMSIESKAGSFAGGGDMAPVGHVELQQLQRDAEGNFELMVSERECPGNWLKMTAETDNLLVRQTFGDRSRERRAELRIECLNPHRSDTLDPQRFAEGLSRVVPFVSGTAGLFREWMGVFSQHINQLPGNDQQMCLRAGGDPGIHYHNSYWQLAADEALLIEFTPPRRCRTWNFQLSNFWMESLDYRYHAVCVNRDGARLEPDGSVRIVVAATNPFDEGANWLSTAGHTEGGMLLRYVEAEEFPPVSTSVQALEDLRRAQS